MDRRTKSGQDNHARYAEIASAAGAYYVYAFAYADASQTWQGATAAASRTERVGRETAERDYVSNGNATARDTALASVAAALTAAKKVTAHDFTVADIAAGGVKRIARAQAARVRVNVYGDADLAHETAAATAWRVYAIGMATAVAARNIATFDAIAAYEVGRDTGVAAAVGAVAGPSTNPWLKHEAALLDAFGDRSATVLPARADLHEILENAMRDFIIASALADETLAVAIATAANLRGDLLADLAYEQAVDQVAADSALAEINSYQTHENLRTIIDGGPSVLETLIGASGPWSDRAQPKWLTPNEVTIQIEVLPDHAPLEGASTVTQLLDTTSGADAAEKSIASVGLEAERLDSAGAAVESELTYDERIEAAWEKWKASWSKDSGDLAAEFFEGVKEGFADGLTDTLTLLSAPLRLGEYIARNNRYTGGLARASHEFMYGEERVAEEDRAIGGMIEKIQGFAASAFAEGSEIAANPLEAAIDFASKAAVVAARIQDLQYRTLAFLNDYGLELIQALLAGDMARVDELKGKMPPELQQAWDLVMEIAVTLIETAADKLDAHGLGYLVGQLLYEACEDAIIGAIWAGFSAATAGVGSVSGAPLTMARVANFTRKLVKYAGKMGLDGDTAQFVIGKVESALELGLRRFEGKGVTDKLGGKRGISDGSDSGLARKIKGEADANKNDVDGGSGGGLRLNGEKLGETAEDLANRMRKSDNVDGIPDGHASIVTRNGTYGRSVDWFDEARVLDDMATSPIGRTVLDAAQSHQFRLQFSKSYYTAAYGAAEQQNILGIAFRRRAKVFLPAHSSNASAARTAIHEGIHMLGVRGSQRAEVLARAAEVLHSKGTVKGADLLRIYREVRSISAYKHLPRSLGQQSHLFPGMTF